LLVVLIRVVIEEVVALLLFEVDVVSVVELRFVDADAIA
jgi:hypothetical protein